MVRSRACQRKNPGRSRARGRPGRGGGLRQPQTARRRAEGEHGGRGQARGDGAERPPRRGVYDAKGTVMAAAQKEKLKSRGKCEKREGGRSDPVQEICRLRQKEEARVRGRARRGRAGVRRSARGSKGRGERRRERERPEKREPDAHSGRLVCGGETFISRTLRKADGWWKTAERRPQRGGIRPSRAARGCAALAPDAPVRRPAAPERAPALPGPARRSHEIGCSCNESAPRGGC